MDYKITTFDVTTEEPALIQTSELPIDGDISLADYSPDIKKILKCEITPFITSKRISGNALEVEGNAHINVIYCDNDDGICSTELELPFKKLFESGVMLDGGCCEASAQAVVHSCRAVTERKLSIRGSVKIDVALYLNKKTQVVSDIDSEHFEQLRGEAEATTPISTTEKSFIVDEELGLDSSLPAVFKIIKSGATPIINESRIVNNKVIVKGEIHICITYCSNESDIWEYKTSLPFNQIIDLIGVSEDCECDTKISLCSLNVSTKTDQSGQCRSFALVSKLIISASARCENNVPIIYDVYSTKYSINPKRQEVKFNKIVHNSSEVFSCKKTLTLPEGEFDEIISLWCKNGGCVSRFNEGSLKLIGTIIVSAIVGSKDGPITFERVIDYEYPLNIIKELKTPICRPVCEISKYNYSALSGSNIELDIELQLSSTVYDEISLSLITDIEVDTAEATVQDNATLVAYFAEKGENVWEIAKSFLANKAELMELNKIKEEVISTPQMLLIPCFL